VAGIGISSVSHDGTDRPRLVPVPQALCRKEISAPWTPIPDAGGTRQCFVKVDGALTAGPSPERRPNPFLRRRQLARVAAPFRFTIRRKTDLMSDGLDGVIAGDTVLSHSDAEAARLWVRGRPIEEAVRELGFEGTVALLWEGFAGTGLELADIVAALGAARVQAFERLDDWLRPAEA
jgi:hypothetical protein